MPCKNPQHEGVYINAKIVFSYIKVFNNAYNKELFLKDYCGECSNKIKDIADRYAIEKIDATTDTFMLCRIFPFVLFIRDSKTGALLNVSYHTNKKDMDEEWLYLKNTRDVRITSENRKKVNERTYFY